MLEEERLGCLYKQKELLEQIISIDLDLYGECLSDYAKLLDNLNKEINDLILIICENHSKKPKFEPKLSGTIQLYQDGSFVKI